jgi:hypothetical protein
VMTAASCVAQGQDLDQDRWQDKDIDLDLDLDALPGLAPGWGRRKAGPVVGEAGLLLGPGHPTLRNGTGPIHDCIEHDPPTHTAPSFNRVPSAASPNRSLKSSAPRPESHSMVKSVAYTTESSRVPSNWLRYESQ